MLKGDWVLRSLKICDRQYKKCRDILITIGYFIYLQLWFYVVTIWFGIIYDILSSHNVTRSMT